MCHLLRHGKGKLLLLKTLSILPIQTISSGRIIVSEKQMT